MKLNTLYKKDSNGKIREWTIKVEKGQQFSTIITTFGEKGGNLVEKKIKISSGTNIGKSNETSHYTQAINQAQAKWEKKRQTGYSESDNPMGTNMSVILPMLAHDYNKQMSKVRFPCYVQPKLDGYRVIYDPDTRKFTSRSGKEYTVLQQSEIAKQLSKLVLSIPLDGELYLSEIPFETFGILRKKSINTEKEQKILDRLEYHVYDIAATNIFKERHECLSTMIETANVKIVNTSMAKSHDEIKRIYQKHISQGYEGSMIRNLHGKYEVGHRSYNLLKFKEFEDVECKIIGFKAEPDQSGGNKPLVVWTCQSPNGKTFDVQPKDTVKERQRLFSEAEKYIGKWLTVQFFSYTNSGKPRFPKTLRTTLGSIRTRVE